MNDAPRRIALHRITAHCGIAPRHAPPRSAPQRKGRLGKGRNASAALLAAPLRHTVRHNATHLLLGKARNASAMRHGAPRRYVSHCRATLRNTTRRSLGERPEYRLVTTQCVAPPYTAAHHITKTWGKPECQHPTPLRHTSPRRATSRNAMHHNSPQPLTRRKSCSQQA